MGPWHMRSRGESPMSFGQGACEVLSFAVVFENLWTFPACTRTLPPLFKYHWLFGAKPKIIISIITKRGAQTWRLPMNITYVTVVNSNKMGKCHD